MGNKIPKKILTLLIVCRHPEVLLGMKKRGFGQGRWNGFGGKVQAGETITAAAKRELREEAGIEADKIEPAGILEFEFKGDPQILEAHVFRTDGFTGQPTESEEMAPHWFHMNDIPFGEMWPADRYWFPFLLQDKKFRGRIFFDGLDKILECDVSAVDELE